MDADWSEVYNIHCVSTAWKAFHNITSTLIDTHALMIGQRVKHIEAPWLSAQIKALLND